MSSSRRRETRLVGVGCEAERVNRMLPPALMKSRRIFGVKLGPSPNSNELQISLSTGEYQLPFDLEGRINK